MKRVEFGKVWNVTTVEEYKNAMQTLEENLFVARMSDDYTREWEETNEIEAQRYAILKQVAAWEV